MHDRGHAAIANSPAAGARGVRVPVPPYDTLRRNRSGVPLWRRALVVSTERVFAGMVGCSARSMGSRPSGFLRFLRPRAQRPEVLSVASRRRHSPPVLPDRTRSTRLHGRPGSSASRSSSSPIAGQDRCGVLPSRGLIVGLRGHGGEGMLPHKVTVVFASSLAAVLGVFGIGLASGATSDGSGGQGSVVVVGGAAAGNGDSFHGGVNAGPSSDAFAEGGRGGGGGRGGDGGDGGEVKRHGGRGRRRQRWSWWWRLGRR